VLELFDVEEHRIATMATSRSVSEIKQDIGRRDFFIPLRNKQLGENGYEHFRAVFFRNRASPLAYQVV